MSSNTELILGPLVFTHAVQKIAIQERKSVTSMDTARTGRNFIVDSGESDHKAQVRLLFTGLDEINNGVAEGSPSGLRALIALFKCSPITVCRNVYISQNFTRLRIHGYRRCLSCFYSRHYFLHCVCQFLF